MLAVAKYPVLCGMRVCRHGLPSYCGSYSSLPSAPSRARKHGIHYTVCTNCQASAGTPNKPFSIFSKSQTRIVPNEFQPPLRPFSSSGRVGFSDAPHADNAPKAGVEKVQEGVEHDFGDTLANMPSGDVFGTLEPKLMYKNIRPPTKEGARGKSRSGKKKTNPMGRANDETAGPQEAKSARESHFPTDRRWTETFGTMTDPAEAAVALELERPPEHGEPIRFADDEGEVDESEKPYLRLSATDRKNAPVWYGHQIRKLVKEEKIYEAIEVLETRMLKEDRVLPSPYVFSLLIGALGRRGYTKKAFGLFNKMKKLKLEPVDHVYTSLFNACANSPWKEDGLDRANNLRRSIDKKEYVPNLLTYKAMIKAYGRQGDLLTAFSIVDELMAAGLRPDAGVFSFLLQACVSDKEAGLKHSIEVWRRMRRRKLRPNSYHFNLLLRAVRECGLGDLRFANELLFPKDEGDQHVSAPQQPSTVARSMHTVLQLRESEKFEGQEEIDGVEKEDKMGFATDTVVEKSKNDKYGVVEILPEDLIKGGFSVMDVDVPNLLSHRSKHHNIVALLEMKKPSEKLLLFGGVLGILKQMGKYDVQPDIKTFSLLLDSIHSTPEAEVDLINAMTAHKVQYDVDFCNMLIRKRNIRKDFEGAKDVLSLISDRNMNPNLQTFGCLAMGCRKRKDGLVLVQNMQDIGVLPSVELCGILMHQAKQDPNYGLAICRIMDEHRLRPNTRFLQHAEEMVASAREMLLQKEQGRDVPHPYNKDYFSESFRKFMIYYKPWLLRMELDVESHPWEAYQNPTPQVSEDPSS